MTSKERVATALSHREPDRVPLMEFAIDNTIIEDLLGHETFWRAHFKEVQAYWDGRRDEIVESQKRDIVQFAREFGQDGIAVSLVPPKGFQPERLQPVDDETWRDWKGNLYRYSEQTHDLGLMKEGAFDAQPAPDLWEPPAEIDPSEWELIDYVLEELGDTHYIMARPGRRCYVGYISAISWEPMMMRLAEDPEGVRADRIRWSENLDWDMFLDHGCDNLAIGEDFGHNHGPFMSPATFDRVYAPSVRMQCDKIHERGLPTLWHACGDNRLILDKMMAAGIDCYQAIQPEEDIVGLRQTTGHKLALWGGISTHTLVMGSPEEIRQQVRDAVHGCAPGGGYVAGASHSVCVKTKPENYLAAIDELAKVGGYPIGG